MLKGPGARIESQTVLIVQLLRGLPHAPPDVRNLFIHTKY